MDTPFFVVAAIFVSVIFATYRGHSVSVAVRIKAKDRRKR